MCQLHTWTCDLTGKIFFWRHLRIEYLIPQNKRQFGCSREHFLSWTPRFAIEDHEAYFRNELDKNARTKDNRDAFKEITPTTGLPVLQRCLRGHREGYDHGYRQAAVAVKTLDARWGNSAGRFLDSSVKRGRQVRIERILQRSLAARLWSGLCF